MRDIGDVRRVMDGRFETTVSPPRNGAATPVAGDRRAIPAALSFLAGGVVVGLVAWGLLRSEPLSLDPTRFALSVATSGGHLNGEIALSPDGRTLVFLAPSGEAEVLYKRLFDRSSRSRLTEPRGPSSRSSRRTAGGSGSFRTKR